MNDASPDPRESLETPPLPARSERAVPRLRPPRRFEAVGVLGLGYVGLPLAAAYRRAGLRTLGFDADPERVDVLNAGRSAHPHLDPSAWGGGRRDGLEATVDLRRVAECDALSLCLPTPVDAAGRPDLTAIASAAEQIAPHLRPGQLVVLHSTVYPGATREVLAPRLQAHGRRLGRDLFIAYSPEREDPGRGVPTHAVPRLVAGLCDRSAAAAVELLGSVVDRVHPTPDVETAEAAKLHENVYRAVNIALAAELGEVYRSLGLDPHAVIEAAATKPYGFEAFHPGPGPGGHCIPVDPRYLTFAAARVGRSSELLERSLSLNAGEPLRWAHAALERLRHDGIDPSGARVLLVGLAYKSNVGDLRESPGLGIASQLLEVGVRVRAVDDWVDPLARALEELRARGLEGPVALEADEVRAADLVLLATAHSTLDLEVVRRFARRVVDPRGALR
ncbi:MAG: nucleotide sugar dehydrogenase [Planctomycetota bacterium]